MNNNKIIPLGYYVHKKQSKILHKSYRVWSCSDPALDLETALMDDSEQEIEKGCEIGYICDNDYHGLFCIPAIL